VEAGEGVFLGPEREREGGEVVDDGDGVAVFGEVDGADAGFAGVAGFYAEVGELLGDVDGEFFFVGFGAVGAIDSAEIPLVQAERTQ
jgi:hypothetical protein